MSNSGKQNQVLLTRAMQVIQERLAALERLPKLDDLMRLLRRLGASSETLQLASAAWALMSSPEDARVLYLALCVLGDEEIAAAMGDLPESSSARVMDAVNRVADRMRTPDGLANTALHEELLRGLAMHLECGIEDEREATSSYLFNNADAILTQMAMRAKDYEVALQRARQAIDTKHRPARPYGE